MGKFAPEIVHGDWHTVELALRKIMQRLGPESIPTFAGITVDGASISSTAVANWNDAFSWGDHALAGYITSVSGQDHSVLDNLDFASSGHTGFQELATNLTSLSGLTFSSESFVKMTAAGTFGLDTATYYKSGDSPTFASVTVSGLTPTRVVFAGTSGLLSGDSDLTFDGTMLSVNTMLITCSSTNNYKLTNTGLTANQLGIEGQAADRNVNIVFMAINNTGSFNVLNRYVGVGSSAGMTNSEYLEIGYDGDPTPANRYCTIRSIATGTGTTVQPIRMYCGTNATQMVFNTNGTISTSHQFNPASLLVGTDAEITGNTNFALSGVSSISMTAASGLFTLNGGGNDISLTFSGGTAVGLIKFWEDEAYFQFNTEVRLDDTLKVTGLSTLTGGVTLPGGANIELATSTGTKIGTATSQLLGFFNATPVAQQTTGVTAATFVQNSGNAVNDASTFDGYTLLQITKALRNLGLLA